MFLSICCLFLAVSCNYKILNPNTGSDNNNNDNTIKKTMYFKLKVLGESQNKYFRVNDTMYANIVNIEANMKTKSYKSPKPPYYFCNNNDLGNTMTTDIYLDFDNLYVKYNEKDKLANCKLYIWIGYDSHKIYRGNIELNIQLDTYDEKIHKNTALITLTIKPDSYTYKLDGFENK